MKQLITAAFLMIATGACAQRETYYRPGIIVTVTDDTIYTLVPMVQNFGVAVLTKKTQESPFDTVPISRIKYLANGTQLFETISFNTANGMMQELMWLKQEGTINLYELIYIDDVYRHTQQVSSRTEIIVGQPMHVDRFRSTTDPPVIIHVIRKNNQTYLLSDKYFQAVVGPLVADKPDVAAKVSSKKYTLEKIDQLVEEYDGE